MKIKFNSDNELPLNKMIEFPSIIIVVRAIFLKITNIIHKFFFMNVYKLQAKMWKLSRTMKKQKYNL